MLPVADVEASDGSEKLNSSQTSNKHFSESAGQPGGIEKSQQPASSCSVKNRTTQLQDDTLFISQQLEQLDNLAFSSSAGFHRLNASRNCSAESTATKVNTDAKNSPMEAAASPQSNQLSSCLSPCAAVQVSNSATDVSGVKSPRDSCSPVIDRSSAGVSPSSAVVSRKSSPGNVRDQLGSVTFSDHNRNEQQCSSVPLSSASDADSPLSTASAPGHLSACLAGGKQLASPGLEKGAGRGTKLLALLKPTKVGAEAPHSSPELNGTASQSADDPSAVLYRKGARSADSRQMPEQILLSAGLDEDVDSRVEPVLQHDPESRQQQVLPRQATAEKLTASKSSDYPGMLMNASATSKTVAPESDTDMRSSPPKSEPTALFQTSSSPVLASQDNDQSSSSKMLTKRLPKIASRSGSRTGTPLPPSTSKSSHSLSSGHSTPASCGTSPQNVHGAPTNGGSESYDCIPVANHTSVPANCRYLFVCIICCF